MNISEKLNSPPPSTILRDFQNQESQFTIPISWKSLDDARKQNTVAKCYELQANAIIKPKQHMKYASNNGSLNDGVPLFHLGMFILHTIRSTFLSLFFLIKKAKKT